MLENVADMFQPNQMGWQHGDSRSFKIPMTLEQAFPGLQNSPAGALIGVADNLFDFTAPANKSMAQFLQDRSRQLTAQIKAIDPS